MLALMGLGGICGSVLRRFDPVDWPTGPSGAYERDFGPLHLTVWGLILQTGRFEAFAANRGSTPITVQAIQIRVDGTAERWSPPSGPIVVPPGEEVQILASFTPPDTRDPIDVVIETSVQTIELQLELP